MAGSDGSLAVSHADGLGSVRALTDAAGNVTQVYRYDAYGVPADPSEPSNPPDQPFRYAGEAKDYAAAGSGLLDLRARTYYPDLGRFLQRDPLGGATADPQSLNRYAYAGNNPATLTDASGLAPAKSIQLTGCFTVPTLFGPSVVICLPTFGSAGKAGQGGRQTQSQQPLCPLDDPHPDDIVLARGAHALARGPESHGGECHVNAQANAYNMHIHFSFEEGFTTDVAPGFLGWLPQDAAKSAANFLTSQFGFRSQRRITQAYSWYVGKLEPRLADLWDIVAAGG